MTRLRTLALLAVALLAGVAVAQIPGQTVPPAFPAPQPGQPGFNPNAQVPPQVRAMLVQRARLTRGIADRLASLQQSGTAKPDEVFQARAAAAHAEVDAADTDAQRLQILTALLGEMNAYEKVVIDSIRANPAAANDVRGRVDRENAVAQLELGKIDLQLSIERLRAGR